MQRTARVIVVGLLGMGLGLGLGGDGEIAHAQAPTPAVAPAPAPTQPIAAPSGWTFDAQLSGRLTVGKRAGLTAATMQAYRPAASGAVLYVTRLELKAAPERRDAIASAEIHELQGALRRQGANAKAEASTQRADATAKQLEAALTWRDASAGVVDSSRTLVAADAQRVVAVTGQCVLSADAAPDLAKACEAALGTLDAGITDGARVPLSIVTDASAAEPAEAPATAAPAATGATGAGDGSSTVPSSSAPAAPSMSPPRGNEPMVDDRRIQISSQRAPKTESDQRPIYVGLGLVVLAALFWWNRSRRERFEADDEATAGEDPAGAPARKRPAKGKATRTARASRPSRTTGDDDADDLHTAAKGPKQDSEQEKDA